MNEFKVGLLALATMAAVVMMTMKVTSTQSGFGDYVQYKTVVQDASGIFPKTPIKVAGINAGRIKEIKLLGNEAHISFEVLKDVRITRGSRLRIKTVGFLGDKFLEINIAEGNEILGSGDTLPSFEGAGMENLMKNVGDMMDDMKTIVKSLREAVAPYDGSTPMTSVVDDLKIVTSNFKEVSENTKILTSDLKDVFSENKEKLEKIVDNFDRFADKLAYHLDQAKDGAAINDLKQILANAEQASEDMKQIIENIRKGKGTIGKMLVEDDIADEVKQTLSSVKKIVSRVDTIRTELSMFTGGNTETGADTEAEFKIYPSPERFYSFGLTTAEFSPTSVTHTTTSVDGGTDSTEVKSRKKEDSFRFNLQVGRKLHNWSFRGGLIESSGGLGVDYDKLNWGSRFSMEAFDYRDEIGVNLRLSYQLQLWNVFYGKLSLEDIIVDNRNATISAGLRFNDEDLKGIIGFFF